MNSTAKIIRAKRSAIILIPTLVFIFCALTPAQDQLSPSKPLHLRWFFESNGTVSITPATFEKVIYAPLSEGVVVSIRVTDGELFWKSEIGGRISASPVADTKGVYVASESFPTHNSPYLQATGALRALSRQSGVTTWMRTLPSPIRGALISNQATLFGGTSDGRLYAIKKENGEILWVKYISSAFNSFPVLSGDTLYVGDDGGNLLALEQATGQTLWRYRTHGALENPVVVNEGSVFAGSQDGSVYAINESTGRLRWRVRTGAAVQSIVDAGKCLLATSLDNFVYCLSPQRGVRLWKYRLAGRVLARPLVIGESVLLTPLVGDEGVILSLLDGKKVNSIYVGEDNNTGASPLLNGNLILLTTRKGLLAFSNQEATAKTQD
ncbi:MAG TPA: PQQ-binding-like beta-propeller repeat protein [Pyrinomonadaceae bacterium]|jgi:outer membrane protein assembly factor BamB|nr:PQQ-binding-like beta-propeller repeat protein [Pyrinomonadaceae bacterium]